MPPKQTNKNKSSGSQKSGNSGSSDRTLCAQTWPKKTAPEKGTATDNVPGPTPGIPAEASVTVNNNDEDEMVSTVPSVASSTFGSLNSTQMMVMFPSKESDLAFTAHPAMLQILTDIKVVHPVIQ